MEVYRIAKTAHIRDLTGTGARLYGGRWNEKGTAIIYTSESRALATVEYLVHVSATLTPTDASIACLRIPDAIVPREASLSDLPPGWYLYPAPPGLAKIGTEWVVSGASLLLRVPSAVVEGEYNILINPAHPAMKQVMVERVLPYRFDRRFLR